MSVLVAATIGLSLWIVLWSVGAKGMDAFLVTILLVVGALTMRAISPYLPGNRE